MVKVEKYLIPEISLVNVDYSAFEHSDTMPVVYNNKPYSNMSQRWVELPTKFVMPYLRELYKFQKNVVLGERFRTIKVIGLENNQKLYIIPNLKKYDEPYLMSDLPFALNTNTDINKMIAEQLKSYRIR